jgi:hypothetical protein
MKLVFKKLGSDKWNTWVKGIKIFRLETKLTDIVTLSDFLVKFSLGLYYNCHPGREVCCVHRGFNVDCQLRMLLLANSSRQGLCDHLGL